MITTQLLDGPAEHESGRGLAQVRRRFFGSPAVANRLHGIMLGVPQAKRLNR